MNTTMPRRAGVPRWAEALVLVVATVCVAAAGAPLGLLWSVLSPRAEVVMTDQGGMYNLETETFAAADGWLSVLTAAAGLVAAVVCWVVLRRYRGPLLLVVLAVGGAGSALLTAWVGSRVGLADFNALLGAAQPGWRFPHPLRLGARGAIVLGPLFAVLAYTVLAGFSRYPALWPRRAGAPPVPELVDPVRLPLSTAHRAAAPAEAGGDGQPDPGPAGEATPGARPVGGPAGNAGPGGAMGPAPAGGSVAGPPARPDHTVPGVTWPAPPAGLPVPPAGAPPASGAPEPPAAPPRNVDRPPGAAQPPPGPGPAQPFGPEGSSGMPGAGAVLPGAQQGPAGSPGSGWPAGPFAPGVGADAFPPPAEAAAPAPMEPVDWPDAPRRS